MEVELEADEAALNCMIATMDGDLGGVEGCTNQRWKDLGVVVDDYRGLKE